MYYDDSVIEQSTVQKLLWHLLPLLCLLSMANVLDRLNLGYAAPAMDPALRLSTAQLRIAGDAFSAGYILASLPAAWLMLRCGARRWIAGIVVAWAVIAVAQATVWNAGSLDAVRFLLGMTEASLLPAMIFYLSDWLPERHRTIAIAALIAAATLVPVVGDQVSNILLLLGRYFGITDWRWLFVVEGLPALWLGLHVLTELPGTLADADWLFPAERHWLQAQRWRRPDAPPAFASGLRHLAVWKLALVRVVVAIVAGSLGLWVPLAMQRTGYLPPAIGAVIMTVASVIGAAGAAAGLRWQDRTQWRRALAAGLALAGACLGLAALVPGGWIAVLLLAVVASIVPAILALTWAMLPCVATGAAVAAGLGLLGMGGALGDLVEDALTLVERNADQRCLALAVACFVAAWLARGVVEKRAIGMGAPAALPGD